MWHKTAKVADIERAMVEGCTYEGVGDCSCPTIELPPKTAAEFAPKEANIPQLEAYIQESYKGLAFNTCTKQTIPTLL